MSKRPFVLVNLLLIFFLAIGIGVTISHYLATGAKIPWGVTVVDIPVGGLSVDEARSKLMACEQDILQKIVTIEFGLQKKRMTVQELGIQIDWPATLLQLSNYGHQGSFARCLRQRWFAWRDGVTLPLQLVMDTTQTEKKLTDTFTGLISESRDAKFEFRGDDEVVVIPEVNGRKIDFKNSFRDLSLLVSEQYPRVHLTLQVLTPEVTASQLAKMKITGVLASYTTSFDPEKNDRVANVKIASAALDNFTLAPGGTFSFNQVVGPRTAVAGYKEALVIQDSAFVPGLGGGVCQVSSTLYNAVLRANLPVLERHQHSLPVGYVPFGTDATVAYGLIDFKFKNNTEGHLMIRTSLSGKNLTIKLFGNAVNRPCIRIISTTEKVAESAVVGFPHDIKGQGIYAYVTVKSGVEVSEALKKELVTHVRKEIGPIASPDKIHFTDALPKTRSGKIMRRILRKIAEGDVDSLGDTSTLADPSVVDKLVEGRQ